MDSIGSPGLSLEVGFVDPAGVAMACSPQVAMACPTPGVFGCFTTMSVSLTLPGAFLTSAVATGGFSNRLTLGSRSARRTGQPSAGCLLHQ